jgi:hypothetical protein
MIMSSAYGGDWIGAMAANIYIYFPTTDDGPDREDIAEELEVFFDGAAEDCGAGCGSGGFNLDYEMTDGEDPHAWADRLKPFLAGIGVPRGTAFTVFRDGWELGNWGWSGGASACSVRTGDGKMTPSRRSAASPSAVPDAVRGCKQAELDVPADGGGM